MLELSIAPPPPPPILYRFNSARLFSVPQLKMKLNGIHTANVAEIQEAVTNEIKQVQKEEFSAAFQKLNNHTKTYIYGSGAYFEFKKSYIYFKTNQS
jgi:ssDNA-specific exonuclease RecJ